MVINDSDTEAPRVLVPASPTIVAREDSVTAAVRHLADLQVRHPDWALRLHGAAGRWEIARVGTLRAPGRPGKPPRRKATAEGPARPPAPAAEPGTELRPVGILAAGEVRGRAVLPGLTVAAGPEPGGEFVWLHQGETYTLVRRGSWWWLHAAGRGRRRPCRLATTTGVPATTMPVTGGAVRLAPDAEYHITRAQARHQAPAWWLWQRVVPPHSAP
ncbi:hypothetical protein [Longispora albida]|uniref:hypothetical protein n=1 Tax=Longispora albida TaxID=203523 RepID=UPI0003801E75|nr:hypothetical protein [Longispora albida]